jgi:DNA replication and repair protein RecF
VIIRGVDIVNFRNIARASLRFSPGTNVITGKNAQGKTNLIEAIYLFSLGRSFRTRSLDEAVSFGEEYFFIRLSGASDAGVGFEIEAGYERGGRARVSTGGKRAPGFADIVGTIPGVIFVAEDIALASGPPAGRRGYLDYTAAQLSPLHFGAIREYAAVLRRRNALLERAAREGAPAAGLEAWDEALAAKGAGLVRIRRETLRELAVRAGALVSEILGEPAGFSMEYACSFAPAGEDPEAGFRAALERARETERRRGYTMIGPQHDDVRILLDETEIRRYGSQGRKRLVSLVLKLAQAATILEKRGERPVVILDDIFSELDRETAARVRELLSDGYQSFISSPREEELGTPAAGTAVFRVAGGVVTATGEPPEAAR